MFFIVYIHYYRSNLFSGLTLHLGLRVKLYVSNNVQDFVQCLLYTVLGALFSSFGV